MQLLHRQTNGKISYSGALQSYQYMYHAYITHVLSYFDPLRIPLNQPQKVQLVHGSVGRNILNLKKLHFTNYTI